MDAFQKAVHPLFLFGFIRAIYQISTFCRYAERRSRHFIQRALPPGRKIIYGISQSPALQAGGTKVEYRDLLSRETGKSPISFCRQKITVVCQQHYFQSHPLIFQQQTDVAQRMILTLSGSRQKSQAPYAPCGQLTALVWSFVSWSGFT